MEAVPMTDPAFGMMAELPQVAFNYDALVAQATAMTAKYKDLVITEDQVKEIKKDMAEINAAKMRLDNARKEVVRRINAPVKEFETKIKKVCAIFEDTYKALGDQVQVFVQKEREQKRVQVEDIIMDAFAEFDGQIDRFEIEIQERWLNKTTTLKSVEDAVMQIIRERIEAKAMAAKIEQAKKERAGAIEQAVNAANAEYGVKLHLSNFMTLHNLDLDTPLEAIMHEISDCANRSLAAMGGPVDIPETRPTDNQTQPPEEKTLSIILTYTTDKEGAVRFALTRLKQQCVSFAVRKK